MRLEKQLLAAQDAQASALQAAQASASQAAQASASQAAQAAPSQGAAAPVWTDDNPQPPPPWISPLPSPLPESRGYAPFMTTLSDEQMDELIRNGTEHCDVEPSDTGLNLAPLGGLAPFSVGRFMHSSM